jgi:hypothetical protein
VVFVIKMAFYRPPLPGKSNLQADSVQLVFRHVKVIPVCHLAGDWHGLEVFPLLAEPDFASSCVHFGVRDAFIGLGSKQRNHHMMVVNPDWTPPCMADSGSPSW